MPVFDRPIKFQASIWTPEAHWGGLARLSEGLVELFQPEIHAYPVPIEIPDEAPRSMPRILLLAPDKRWQFSATPDRCDLHAAAGEGRGIAHIERAQFWTIASQKLLRVIDQNHLDVSRVAGVFEAIGHTEEHMPAEYLREHFLSPSLDQRWTENLHDAEVHFHRRLAWSAGETDVPTNHWVRLRAMRLIQGGEAVLSLLVDVNTVADPQQKFTADEIREFYSVMDEHVRSVLEMLE